jgi:hypothetical protein
MSDGRGLIIEKQKSREELLIYGRNSEVEAQSHKGSSSRHRRFTS